MLWFGISATDSHGRVAAAKLIQAESGAIREFSIARIQQEHELENVMPGWDEGTDTIDGKMFWALLMSDSTAFFSVLYTTVSERHNDG
ncbi:hypothetical protein KIMH_07670 [Bombiscardovia apis]|uniref:Transposase n=1 Tax=Bombiscardovia apis TaxID=2932182 RepID=A0ABM8BCL2_9BIFI|nr:hypothetical protein KIMH_07670 [Bombiscardovia apis]